MLTFETIDDLFDGVIDEVLTYGKATSPRGMKVSEVRGMTLELTSPDRNMLVNRVRKPNYSFMVAEWLWMAAGRSDVAMISQYNKEIAKFSDDGVRFFGAYGPSIKQTLPQVIKLLKTDPDTRRAVVSPWTPLALFEKTKDVPCTLTWQFFIREGLLEMHVNMRSNDVWLGLPYDIFNFTQFQRVVAAQLGLDVGSYIHHVGSLHLYEQHWAKAQEVIGGPVISQPSDFSPRVDGDGITDLFVLMEILLEEDGLDRARIAIELMDKKEWQEYASLLLYRFSKNPSDLRPFARGLVGV